MSSESQQPSVLPQDLVEFTADIVSAFVSNNSLPTNELPNLIASVHTAMASLQGVNAPAPEVPLTPAVPVKKSVGNDFIICLEDGKKFKSLRRHLSSTYNMTPDEYRAKWNLPRDYPMVAPSYSATRSELAKQNGLGNRAAAPQPVREQPVKKSEAPAPRRGRPRKAA